MDAFPSGIRPVPAHLVGSGPGSRLWDSLHLGADPALGVVSHHGHAPRDSLHRQLCRPYLRDDDDPLFHLRPEVVREVPQGGGRKSGTLRRRMRDVQPIGRFLNEHRLEESFVVFPVAGGVRGQGGEG